MVCFTVENDVARLKNIPDTPIQRVRGECDRPRVRSDFAITPQPGVLPCPPVFPPLSFVATSLGISAYESAGSARTAGGAASSGSSDTVTISAQAYRKRIESQIESELASTTTSWTSLFGLESGTTTLENGNTRVVTIDGAKMEIGNTRAACWSRRKPDRSRPAG
jgi:hypothetical protein